MSGVKCCLGVISENRCRSVSGKFLFLLPFCVLFAHDVSSALSHVASNQFLSLTLSIRFYSAFAVIETGHVETGVLTGRGLVVRETLCGSVSLRVYKRLHKPM